jgi:hypothetical protein
MPRKVFGSMYTQLVYVQYLTSQEKRVLTSGRTYHNLARTMSALYLLEIG